jgi:hypothetical protein
MYEQMNKHMYVYLFVDLFFIETCFLSVFWIEGFHFKHLIE